MLFNIIGFNISWFGLVLLGSSFIPFTLFWIGLHCYRCKYTLAELKLIISVTLIGILIDSALLSLNVFIFNEQLIIPLWLIKLWAAFASTLAHSLHFLSHSKALQFIIGFLFPPLSYIGGASLSAVDLGHDVLITYFILAPIWGVLMMLFYSLKDKFYYQVATNE